MSFASISEADVWPRVRRAVADERERRYGDLLAVATLEMMRHEQGFIAALDWVLAEARPKPLPPRREDDE